jgi:DNA-binding NarL/FixJ family response regulator
MPRAHSEPSIRVLLADDHELVRTGLRRIIEAQPDMAVVAETGEAGAISRLAGTSGATLALLDISMPGGGGLAALRALRERFPALRVLVVTMHDDQGHLRLAIEAGASGYVVKSASASELIQAIRTVHGGRTYMSAGLDDGSVAFPGGRGRGRDSAASACPELTAREREVVELVARGHTSREIAATLGLSVKTVEHYRQQVMEKLGLETRAELVSYALGAGLLRPLDEGPGR